MFFCSIFLVLFSFHTVHCDEKKIVLISCCYNAESSIERTLDSIFSQKYSNFRVVLVNDASTDTTKELIDTYLERIHNVPGTPQCCVVHNGVRRRKLANLYTILHECDPDEIVFLLDGDDWLSHDQVVRYISEQYNDTSVWMTFGNYQNNPAHVAKEWGIAEGSYCATVSDDVIAQLLYRKKPFVYMHPRTFYAWLFHQVKLADLITERIPAFAGDFFPACNDLAMFFPMVELAGTHVQFIDEILYNRNVASALVGFKIDSTLQRQAAHEIRRKRSYQPLETRPKQQSLSVAKNLLFIVNDTFFIQNEMQEFKTIGRLKKNNSNIRKIINGFARRFDYCIILNTKKRASITHTDLERVMQLLERTGCPVALFYQKPGCALALSDSVHVWKRSLNVHLPQITTCMISLPQLAQFVQKNDINKTIKDACNSYIQSFQYDAALSIFF